MKPCLECGSPLVKNDQFCPSCGAPTKGGKPKVASKRRCDVSGCDSEATFHAGANRCWQHYNADMDRSPHMDWRESAVRAEYKRLDLTRGQKGETLREYIERQGLTAQLGMYRSIVDRIDRAPGSDDDMGD